MALIRRSLVLLQSLCLGERLRSSMRTMLFYVEVMGGGSPAGVSLFSNFTGNLVESLGSLVLSALDRM